VRDSILLSATVVEPGAVVDRCIVDKDVVIGSGAVVGDGEDNTPNQRAPELLNTGLTLVGRSAQIPANVRIGRNVVIRPRVTAASFGAQTVVSSGVTINR
jgi:glucose-1-phosphate adenylyltransferase